MTDLRQIIAEVLAVPVKQLTDDALLKDIPTWSSLAHIELVVRLEETYHVELDQDEIVEMTSVGTIRDVLRRHRGEPD